MKTVLFLLMSAALVVAQDLKPFDKFGKDNVRLDFRMKTSTDHENQWRTSWGSRGDEKTVTKVLAIECRNGRGPVTVEAFFVRKNGSDKYIVPAGERELRQGDGEAVFSETGKSAKYKFVMLGEQTKEEDKVYGWLARAISSDGRIIGALGSAEAYQKLAENPVMLSEELKGHLR